MRSKSITIWMKYFNFAFAISTQSSNDIISLFIPPTSVLKYWTGSETNRRALPLHSLCLKTCSCKSYAQIKQLVTAHLSSLHPTPTPTPTQTHWLSPIESKPKPLFFSLVLMFCGENCRQSLKQLAKGLRRRKRLWHKGPNRTVVWLVFHWGIKANWRSRFGAGMTVIQKPSSTMTMTNTSTVNKGRKAQRLWPKGQNYVIGQFVSIWHTN